MHPFIPRIPPWWLLCTRKFRESSALTAYAARLQAELYDADRIEPEPLFKGRIRRTVS